MTQPYDRFAHHEVNPPTSLSLRKIPCRSPGCNRWFCNNAGLTKHMRTKHLVPPLPVQECPILAPQLFDDAPNPPAPDLDAPMDGGMDEGGGQECPEWDYHATLRGTFSLLTQQLTCSLILFYIY
jgi:hypothetical protein